MATFTNGVLANRAAGMANALTFLDGSSATAASDGSHVDGYVTKMGNADFTFPVGDATIYKSVSANIISNTQGLTAAYFNGNGGTENYSPGYNGEMINGYNSAAYWDIMPVGTAAATITLPYDNSYSGVSSDYTTNLVVAHYQNNSWHSEGGVVSGDQTSGTVTTAGSVSSWSPFTIGTIAPPITTPVQISSFMAKENGNVNAVTWITGVESNIKSFELESSSTGNNFEPITSLTPQGSNSTYTFQDTKFSTITYYRLRTLFNDGSSTVSGIISINRNKTSSDIQLYPNPVKRASYLNVANAGTGTIIIANSIGQTVLTIKGTGDQTKIDMPNLIPGIYFMIIKGKSYKLIIQ